MPTTGTQSQPAGVKAIDMLQQVLDVASGKSSPTITFNYDVPNSVIIKVLLGLLAVLVLSGLLTATFERLINPAK